MLIGILLLIFAAMVAVAMIAVEIAGKYMEVFYE